ncbi:pentatricopeptide repeat-containing protein 2, mitochondrial-like isoform X2 [Homarus americanus]|uniref:pentatricopeptide repeat-containing protein 2, mitochondrial-like isoform X2 n=1 Tax=Homarus americanus TaxID=6706 RepID=UPI001C489CFB|nr:pentatricopeptide repeat-containing protein 2, mitochondrial-like isoform X2 [Homarus americanus]
MSMSAVLFTCRNILHKVPRTRGSGLSTPLWPSGCHHLFTPAALGLDNFTEVRERTAFQFTNMSDKFKMRMEEIIASKGKTMIFTEDLKNVVHLAEAKDEDLSLVMEMTKKFNQQHQGLRFGAFVFGPVVMRMYHHLNQPDAALQPRARLRSRVTPPPASSTTTTASPSSTSDPDDPPMLQ